MNKKLVMVVIALGLVFGPAMLVVVPTNAQTTVKSVNLKWSAPADDKGMATEGPVTAYKLVVSTAPITETNFNNATVLNTTTPKAPGTQESYTYNLTDGRRYYFAVKSVDAASNWSPLSNIASTDFLAPSPVADLSVQ